ncbi:camphor resistance protein CrcB [Maricaulis maris MCS10]|uniref:Fluoride-specific ion channel FluC n=2 Tax=Maricaulaceae TaxID=2800061 RepID=Q0ANT1_MARMM|nr:camphor resistance protein CrcB [Maricaulis maris MCS10]
MASPDAGVLANSVAGPYRAAMINYLLVGAGGALGAVSRYQVGRLTFRWFGPEQVWGTFAVNVAGGLLMGLLIGWLAATGRADQQYVRLFGAVGFLGGFTTFSAFSLEIANMVERKAFLPAFTYAASSVVVALAAVFVGLWLMRKAYS